MPAALAPHALSVIAVVANGLIAGVFFVFACAITVGFQRLGDRAYVSAFRTINRAILNGWFLTVFFAAPISAVALAVVGPGPSWPFIVAAVASAVTFGITAAVNVPMNTRLEQAPVSTDAEVSSARAAFESPWNRANLVRTLTSVIALTALTAGLLGV